MKKKIGALILALPVSLSAMALSANAATQSSIYLKRGYQAGVHLVNGSELVAEKMKVTMEISREDLGSAKYGTATVDYTLYNPTSSDASFGILFPVGGRSEMDADYSIKADGEELEYSLRHLYAGENGAAEDIMRLSMEEDAFYSETMPVRQYIFEPNASGETDGNYLKLTFDCNPVKTRVAFSQTAVTGIKNGRGEAVFSLSGGENRLCLYVIGDDLISLSAYIVENVSSNRALGSISFIQSDQSDFVTLAMGGYPSETAVSEADWYRGFISMCNENTVNGYMITETPESFGEEAFVCWCGYELELSAGGRSLTTVEMPLSPSVVEKSFRYYGYEFLLSPALDLANVKEVEIVLITDCYLMTSSLEFTETESGYLFTRNSLPQGELTIFMSEYEIVPGPYVSYEGITPALTSALVLLGIIVAVAVVAVIVMFAISKRTKKRLSAEEERADRGKPQVGSIDLDPVEDVRNNGNKSGK